LTTAALAQHGFEIEALDSVPAMLDLTRHRLLETGTEARVRTTCADVRHLPFPDNNFDLVFALGVVMWVDPPFGAIQQMARVTRPGGYVLITAMHRPHLVEFIDPWKMPSPRSIRRGIGSVLAKLKLWRPGPGPQVHRHSLREFDSMILDAGLSKVFGVTLGFGPFTFFGREFVPDSIGIKVHQFLQTAANRRVPTIRAAGAQYIVLAQKIG